MEVLVCGDDLFMLRMIVAWLNAESGLQVHLLRDSAIRDFGHVVLVVDSRDDDCRQHPETVGLPDLPRVFLTSRCTPASLWRALACQAVTLLCHADVTSSLTLRETLAAAAQGLPLMDPCAYLAAFPRPHKEVSAARPCGTARIRITPRELEIGCALTRSGDYQRIGDAHYVSAATVKYFVRSLLAKTGLRDRQELADYFLQELPSPVLPRAFGTTRIG